MARSDSTGDPRASILVIEDVATVRRLIASMLAKHGFAVAEAEDWAEAVAQLDQTSFDVVLLDLELPDGDGLDLCRLLRDGERGGDAYIVIVSGRTTEADRIQGLDAGADDYLVKPFSPEELVLRIEAMLRRPRRRLTDPVGDLGPKADPATPAGQSDWLRLLPESQAVELHGSTVELTKIEYALLARLLGHAGSVVQRDDLIEACWGPSPTDDHHLLSVHVANLRRKVDPDGELIRTRRGVGYLLDLSASLPAAT